MSDPAKTYTQAELDAAVAAARQAVRDRVGAILDCSPAKDRPVFARHLALATDMSPTEAEAALAAAAVEAVPRHQRSSK